MVTELVLHRPLSPVSELESVLLDHPDLAFHSLNASISAELLTMVFHVTGSPESLNALKQRYIDCPPSQSSVEILGQRRRELLVYEQERIGESPIDLSVHIYRELGPDVIVRVKKNNAGATWRIIVFHHDRIKGFLDRVGELKTELDSITQHTLTWYTMKKLSNPRWDEVPLGRLSPSDEHILQTAWRMGFFAVPRRTDLGKLATHLKYSRSGLNYRLRKAVERVMSHYLPAEP